jgi:hypothetical protein
MIGDTTKLNNSCGTSSITCQIPHKDIGNHWTKYATTNKDIVFAALGDSRNACEDFPKEVEFGRLSMMFRSCCLVS